MYRDPLARPINPPSSVSGEQVDDDRGARGAHRVHYLPPRHHHHVAGPGHAGAAWRGT